MMKIRKNEKRWLSVLAIVTVVYCVLLFALPFPKNGVFALSLIFSLIALGAQIYVIRSAFFQGEAIRSKFYGFPIAKIGLLYLMVQLVLGLLFAALGTIVPFAVPLVTYVLLLGAAAVGLIGAEAVREETERQEVRLKKDVSRRRRFQAHVEMLEKEGQIPEAKEALRELSEAFRYSDPVSSEVLQELEEQLAEDLAQLKDALALLEKDKVMELCRKTRRDLEERNQNCKLHKNEK